MSLTLWWLLVMANIWFWHEENTISTTFSASPKMLTKNLTMSSKSTLCSRLRHLEQPSQTINIANFVRAWFSSSSRHTPPQHTTQLATVDVNPQSGKGKRMQGTTRKSGPSPSKEAYTRSNVASKFFNVAWTTVPRLVWISLLGIGHRTWSNLRHRSVC